MKKFAAFLLVATCISLLFSFATEKKYQPKPAPVLTIDGVTFRDLNKNGRLDAYEDRSQPIEKRVEDLLSQMTLEEKAGSMFINGTFINEDGTIEKKPGTTGFAAMLPPASEAIQNMKMNHFNFWQLPGTRAIAVGYNSIQKEAEKSRLGIPVTIASDPRNSFSNNIFSMAATDFSQWCEPLGFAAIGDEKLMWQHANICRQEYRAVGLRVSLHPQIDLATEPRWPRISGGFGEDAALSARLVKAYIKGFQGEKLDSNSVACMTKHFPGGGPQKEGLDPHFEFQKGQVYPGKNFNYHLIPFEAAFEAGTASIMPYYGIPTDQTSENVAMAYNKDIITGLLRNKYKFDGVVCTDWGLVTDAHMGPVTWPARAWGAEKLSEEDRVLKIIQAGCDQFGGESCPQHVVSLVKKGKLSEARVNESVRRLLRQKFQLGLFDNPYVDVNVALETLGRADFREAAELSQRRAMTLLKNADNQGKKALPLAFGKLKIYVKNISEEAAAAYGTVVGDPKDADVAIVRLNTPWTPVESQNMFARMFHHGDLDFKGSQLDSLVQLMKTLPTIVDIYLDRPAVIPEISQHAAGLLADFGASDLAVLDVVFGRHKPGGKLPFELPSSMVAVKNQKEDLPHDSEKPLYKFGFGMSY
ncbi:MAG: glycoside hydrolase family 3 N-terminal domain-containing protein [Bacteroidota bacterium]